MPLPVAWFDERQLAVIESEALGLPFLPLVLPVQGRAQTPISWPDFYRAVGRDDAAASAEFNDDLRTFMAWPLLVGGAVAVVAGIGTGAVITSAKDGTSDVNVSNAAVAVAIGGGVGVVLCVAGVVTAVVALDAVPRAEQERLAAAHNAALRQKLGLPPP